MAEGMLTYDNPNGTWGLNNGYDIREAPEELQEALCRLHDYEKTGFSAESIMEIRHKYDEFVRRGDAMAKAAGMINSVNLSAVLSDPKIITKLFKLVGEVMECLDDMEKKTVVSRKDGDNDKL